MNQQELDGILQKAAELKVFCEYGERTIPVLDEIASFVREISPAIEDLRAVVEVSMVNIPKAADQLARSLPAYCGKPPPDHAANGESQPRARHCRPGSA